MKVKLYRGRSKCPDSMDAGFAFKEFIDAKLAECRGDAHTVPQNILNAEVEIFKGSPLTVGGRSIRLL